jgi:hypothetical protein
MVIKHKTCDIQPEKKHVFLNISSTNIDTLVLIALPVRQNPQHGSLLNVVSATSAPPFQPLRHQRNLCHIVVNRFTRQTPPTVNRNSFIMNIISIEFFCSQETHNRTLIFGSILRKYGRHLTIETSL